jgi:hypothetical protein
MFGQWSRVRGNRGSPLSRGLDPARRAAVECLSAVN